LRTTEIIITTLSHHIIKMYRVVQERAIGDGHCESKKVPL